MGKRLEKQAFWTRERDVRKLEPGANEDLALNTVDFPTIVCSLPGCQPWESPRGARTLG